MLKEVRREDLDRILSYLKPDVENCIYMYTDIFMYGVDNPNMKLWFTEEAGEIKVVVMKYHDSISVYSDLSAWDCNKVVELIKEQGVTMVNARREMIVEMAPLLETDYYTDYGYIVRLENYIPVGLEDECSMAAPDDIPEIAELLSQDDFYKDSYTAKEIEEQFKERMTTGMGRSCIIRRDGKIVAHCASFTEADGIAVRAGTICHKDYRGQKLGIAVENYITMYMNEHGYQWYTFLVEENRRETFEKMGNPVVAYYGKLIKKR